MVKRPVYISRYPGDERVEKQREETRQRFLRNVYRDCKFKGIVMGASKEDKLRH